MFNLRARTSVSLKLTMPDIEPAPATEVPYDDQNVVHQKAKKLSTKILAPMLRDASIRVPSCVVAVAKVLKRQMCMYIVFG